MAHYCSNSIYLCSRSREQLTDLARRLQQVQGDSMADLLQACGLQQVDVDLRDRVGYVQEQVAQGRDCYYLSLETETAWQPHMEAWQRLVEQSPGLWLYYCSEEPSMDLYETNDGEQRFFKDRYRVEYALKGREDCCYLKNEQALQQALLELTGKEYGPMEVQELERRAGQNLVGEEYIRIREFVVK